MLCDASISASATVLQVVSRTLDANAMPVKILQLCKCWLCDADINAGAKAGIVPQPAVGRETRAGIANNVLVGKQFERPSRVVCHQTDMYVLQASNQDARLHTTLRLGDSC